VSADLSTGAPVAGADTATPTCAVVADWAGGRLAGYVVPPSPEAFEVVQCLLDGRVVATALADGPVFELGLPALLGDGLLPARERCGFEFRIPHRSLLPAHLAPDAPGATVEVQGRDGRTLWRRVLAGPRELLRLTEGSPLDLLYAVEVQAVQGGVVEGVVRDRLAIGHAPRLTARLNDQAAEPLPILDSAADGTRHVFSVPLVAEHLVVGRNVLHIGGPDGQPLFAYPIQIGPGVAGEAERRITALEAEVAFLKHLVLNQTADTVGARLSVLKGELVNICADMLALQRTHLEREMRAARGGGADAPGA
jgi:hypothetical protein